MKLLILALACLVMAAFAAPTSSISSLDPVSSRQLRFRNCAEFCDWVRRSGRRIRTRRCRCFDPVPVPTNSAEPVPPTSPAPAPPTDPAPPASPAPPTTPSNDKIAACLGEHNRERAAVGVAPVTWNTALERSAQEWANTIKNEGRLRHSTGLYPGVGENLSAIWGVSSMPTWERLHKGWIDEKKYFKNGVFPDVSTTGNWADVGHYTAMIWRDVTEIGCAVGVGSGDRYTFVCHYTPHPNVRGQKTL